MLQTEAMNTTHTFVNVVLPVLSTSGASWVSAQEDYGKHREVSHTRRVSMLPRLVPNKTLDFDQKLSMVV